MTARGFSLVFATLVLPLILPLSADAAQSGKGAPGKQICVTFDELPASGSFDEVDTEAITFLILETLKRHEVHAAGFVVGQRIEGSYDVLGQWLNDGHVLGNMTYSNQDLHELTADQFIQDVVLGGDALETMLEGFGQKGRYFRYPFLHYGNTVQQKREVRDFLEGYDYTIGHVTVTVEDYLYNLSIEKMGKQPDSAEFLALMNEYVNHVLDRVEETERLSQQVLGRNCRQILQLKANRLNAVFLEEILTQIENLGYTFISLGKALKDDVYEAPEAYIGSKGVGYIEMIMYSNPDLLPAE